MINFRMFLILAFLVSCVGGGGGGGGGSSKKSKAPFLGNVYGKEYHQGEDAYILKYVYFDQEEKGDFLFVELITNDINTLEFFYRAYSGKYKKSGSSYEIEYDYQTCDFFNNEKLKFSSSDYKKSIKFEFNSVDLNLNFIDTEDSGDDDLEPTLIEDSDCVEFPVLEESNSIRPKFHYEAAESPKNILSIIQRKIIKFNKKDFN